MSNLRIEYDGEWEHFEGFIGNERVCEMELFMDNNGNYWLNGIDTKADYQRKGYATQLIEKAIDVIGYIYISKAIKQIHDMNGDNTARWLTTDGAALINRLTTMGILKEEWGINPFDDYDYDEI